MPSSRKQVAPTPRRVLDTALLKGDGSGPCHRPEAHPSSLDPLCGVGRARSGYSTRYQRTLMTALVIPLLEIGKEHGEIARSGPASHSGA